MVPRVRKKTGVDNPRAASELRGVITKNPQRKGNKRKCYQHSINGAHHHLPQKTCISFDHMVGGWVWRGGRAISRRLIATWEHGWCHAGISEGIPHPIVAICAREEIIPPARRAICIRHRILRKTAFLAGRCILDIGTCSTSITRIIRNRPCSAGIVDTVGVFAMQAVCVGLAIIGCNTHIAMILAA
jgi:hypothetical protein